MQDYVDELFGNSDLATFRVCYKLNNKVMKCERYTIGNICVGRCVIVKKGCVDR